MGFGEFQPDRDEVLSDLREQMKTLETKMAHFESRPRHDSIAARTEMTDDILDNDQGIKQLTNATTIFKVQKCNVTEFKNRFSEDKGRYAVDVLVSGALLSQEIREELKLREQRTEYGVHWEQYHQQQEQQTGAARKSAVKANEKAMKKATNISSRNSNAIRKAQASDTWIRRIRLQSPALLKILSNVQGETWSSRPRTYFRPFSSLLYFHPQMKRALAELEQRWSSFINPDGSIIPTSPTATTTVHDDFAIQDDLQEDHQEPVDNCPSALLAMRCYISFMDAEVIPLYHRWATLDNTDAAKLSPATLIRFSDLGYLFRTGEYLYRDLDSDEPGKRDFRMGKKTWRCYGMHVPDTRVTVTPSDHHKYDGPAAAEEDHNEPGMNRPQPIVQYQSDDATGNDASSTDSTTNEDFNPAAFIIRAYYIEFTGDEFCTVTKDFPIIFFKGMRQITTLPIYPVRFSPGGMSHVEGAIMIGRRVLHYIDTRHGTYNAWTVMRTPKGNPVRDVNGVVMKHPEHINSEILVDFAEAFQTSPGWKPRPTILRQRTVEQITESDEFAIMWWDGPDRKKLVGETSEVVPIRTGVGMWAQNKFVTEEDGLLIKIVENDARAVQTTREYLREEDLALISCRVFAYVFQERKFAQLDVRYIVDSTGVSKEALNFLRIPQKVKDMIQKSVKGHLIQKAAEKTRVGQARISQDFIRGKGAGLFILLHGVPGVGKTATAEAVAQTNGKPLFKITCGDLGLTPEQVENSLRGIFRLASLWDCILLMDEVDTFFSQRSKGDGAMTKNALVSVFLRILDWYSGILFMTTNRAGSLDEAFKSRIHYKIYYPPLSKQQTLEIWQINLQRLHKIEEEEQRQWTQSEADDFNTDYNYNTSISLPRAPHQPMDIPDEEILRFARLQFESSRRGTLGWNGRQIRNAFQVAKSLAYADAAAEAERLEAETLALAVQNRITAEIDRVIIPAPRLQVKHFKVVHEITEEFDQYMEEVFSGMNASKLAREKEERADDFLQPDPVQLRPGSGTGWRKQHSSDSHLSRHEEETTCFESTLSMSRPSSRGAAGGGVGLQLPPRSPRMSNAGENWVNGPSLAIPVGGGGLNLGLGVRVGMASQQQRQFQKTRSARLPSSSPLLQATGPTIGGGYFPDEHAGLHGRGQGVDNGPLPGQIAQQQERIGNAPRTFSQGQFYPDNMVGQIGEDEGNYMLGDGIGGGLLNGNENEASRSVSPGLGLSPGIHYSVLSIDGGPVGGSKVPRGMTSHDGSYSIAVGSNNGMME